MESRNRKTHVKIEGTNYIFSLQGKVDIKDLAWCFDDSGFNEDCGVKLLQIKDGYVIKTYRCKAKIRNYCKNSRCTMQLCEYSHDHGINFCKNHNIGMLGKKLVKVDKGFEFPKQTKRT